MYPAGSAFRGPPRSGELARSRAEGPVQTLARSPRPGLETATMRLPHSFALLPERGREHSTPHEPLRTEPLALAALPAELTLLRGPRACLLPSNARERPTSSLPGVGTTPGLPVLSCDGLFRFPLPLYRS